MTKKERKVVWDSLHAYIDEWITKCQDSDTPFDCYIADNTVALMTNAAFAVIEAVDDAQDWLKREGQLVG